MSVWTDLQLVLCSNSENPDETGRGMENSKKGKEAFLLGLVVWGFF